MDLPAFACSVNGISIHCMCLYCVVMQRRWLGKFTRRGTSSSVGIQLGASWTIITVFTIRPWHSLSWKATLLRRRSTIPGAAGPELHRVRYLTRTTFCTSTSYSPLPTPSLSNLSSVISIATAFKQVYRPPADTPFHRVWTPFPSRTRPHPRLSTQQYTSLPPATTATCRCCISNQLPDHLPDTFDYPAPARQTRP